MERFKKVKVIGKGSFGAAILVQDAAGKQLILKEITVGLPDDTCLFNLKLLI
jgi:hypothetical protein